MAHCVNGSLSLKALPCDETLLIGVKKRPGNEDAFLTTTAEKKI